MTVPLILSFWIMVAAYVIHVLDESLLGGSFVEKVQKHWWPAYSWRKFFWFNTGYFVIMISSVVLYDIFGGSFVILPLAWAIERTCNGFWHVWWAVRYREYSPGLVTSILIWMDSYFILRYRPASEAVSGTEWGVAAIIGLLAATFLAFFIPLVEGNRARRSA